MRRRTHYVPRRQTRQTRPIIPTPPLELKQRASQCFIIRKGQALGTPCEQPRARLHVLFVRPCHYLCVCDMVHVDEGAGRCCTRTCSGCGRDLYWKGWDEWVTMIREKVKMRSVEP